jgi:hypothetical protein
VGASTDGARTVILHWNGTSWQPVASPSPTGSNDLFGVAATSAGNAWAVGDITNGGVRQPLAVHCC